jgi:hypothetical protein
MIPLGCLLCNATESTCTLDQFGVSCNCVRPYTQSTDLTCASCPFSHADTQQSPCYFSSCNFSPLSEIVNDCCRNITAYCLNDRLSYGKEAGCRNSKLVNDCNLAFHLSSAIVTGESSFGETRRLPDWLANVTSVAPVTLYQGAPIIIVGNFTAIRVVEPAALPSWSSEISTIRNPYKNSHVWFTTDRLQNDSFLQQNVDFAFQLTDDRRRAVHTTSSLTMLPPCPGNRCDCNVSCDGEWHTYIPRLMTMTGATLSQLRICSRFLVIWTISPCL